MSLYLIYATFVMQIPSALLWFPITWLAMRSRNRQKLKLGAFWAIAGFLVTTALAALFRLAAIALDAPIPKDSEAMFFFLISPILAAICVCAFLRTKAKQDVRAD